MDFHLLRGPAENEQTMMFASHTVWKDQDAFLGWTKSEAFQKAHAQGHKTSAFMRGPPKFVGWTSVL